MIKTLFSKKMLAVLAAAVGLCTIGVGVGFGANYLALSRRTKTPLALPAGFTVTAHTGAMGTEENSLHSISEGAKHADIVEFDVRFNAEGGAYLGHDVPKKGKQAVSLAEAFALIKGIDGIRANVDLKEDSNLFEISRLAAEHGVAERIFFTGVDARRAQKVRAECPEIPFYLNVVFDRKSRKSKAFCAQAIADAQRLGAVGINTNFDYLPEGFVADCRAAGLLTSVWTVSKLTHMYKTLPHAPDNITTREPQKLNQVITKWKK